MKNIKEVNWKVKDDQLNKDVLRRHRDEDIRDDDAIISERVADSKLPGNGTDPDEIPEEHKAGDTEVKPPNEGGVEHGKGNEADHKHPKEVTPPNPSQEPEKHAATLDNLDPTFIGVEHARKTKRIVDHEPGVAGDHRAPNL